MNATNMDIDELKTEELTSIKHLHPYVKDVISEEELKRLYNKLIDFYLTQNEFIDLICINDERMQIDDLDKLYNASLLIRTIVSNKPLTKTSDYIKISECSLDDLIIKQLMFDKKTYLIYNNEFKNNNHELMPDIIGELLSLDYSSKTIPMLAQKVLENYLMITSEVKSNKINLLSAAFIITCRGDYQCPVGLNEHYKRSSSIFKKNHELLNKIEYSSNELTINYLKKYAQKYEILPILLDNIIRFVSTKKIKNPKITAASLIYYARKQLRNRVSGHEIAKTLGTDCISMSIINSKLNEIKPLFVDENVRQEYKDYINEKNKEVIINNINKIKETVKEFNEKNKGFNINENTLKKAINLLSIENNSSLKKTEHSSLFFYGLIYRELDDKQEKKDFFEILSNDSNFLSENHIRNLYNELTCKTLEFYNKYKKELDNKTGQ